MDQILNQPSVNILKMSNIPIMKVSIKTATMEILMVEIELFHK